jgi:hypothetical protein
LIYEGDNYSDAGGLRALNIREQPHAERTQTDESEHTRPLPFEYDIFTSELTPKADSRYCEQHGAEEVEGDACRRHVNVMPNVRAKLPAEGADDRPRRDDGNARPERPGIGCRSGSA